MTMLYDVIIAGAGPAGCVLASRLSEDGSKRVLLVEAGPDVVPGAEHADLLDPFAVSASANSDFHWPDLVAEQYGERADGLATATPYLQARCVGGGSNINGMCADRGVPDDYAKWSALGVEGWQWEDVLPYFKKLENDLAAADTDVMHGRGGPLPIRRRPRSAWPPFCTSIAEAFERRGFRFIADYNSDFDEGFGSVPTNGLPDRRVSASMAYLDGPVRLRRNLTIMADSRVDRLVFEGNCITGLDVTRRNIVSRMHGKQVILACGALQTPALLMRSGIGAREDLERLGLDVVMDAPAVGANLQNHPCIGLTTYLSKGASQPPDNRSFAQNWLRYSSNHDDCDQQDMNLMAFNKCAWHPLGSQVGMLLVTVLNSFSRGRVELVSPDPAVQPRICFNFLSDERDFERLVSGTRMALELLGDPLVERNHHGLFIPTTAMAGGMSTRSWFNSLKASAVRRLLEWAPMRRAALRNVRLDVSALLADERALRDFVKTHAFLEFHVCGTCRMGVAGDPQAVVDSSGRVHGVDGLRVADASIFPVVPRGFTHMIVLMAAEKIADTVKSDWRDGRAERGPRMMAAN